MHQMCWSRAFSIGARRSFLDFREMESTDSLSRYEHIRIEFDTFMLAMKRPFIR